MKVILLDDVKGTGKRGDVVEVKDGFCNNFLLPKKLALPANRANVQILEKEKQHILKLKDEEYKKALELSKKIDGKSFAIAVKAGESGKLFGSVTNKEIAVAVMEAEGISIDRKKIALKEPLKTTGSHEVSVKLHPEIETKIIAVLAPAGAALENGEEKEAATEKEAE